MTNHAKQTVLVAGGTGKTGRRVAARLTARGVPVRLGHRGGTPPFDWDDRATWGALLQGVAAAYIAFAPDVAIPGSPAVIRAFTEQAVAAGVGRLVLLSGRGEEEAQRSEQALQAAAGPSDWTVVRASWFAQNFDESIFLEPVLAGEVALPAGDVREPFIDTEDIADVAVAALTEDGHAGRVYEVTGPRSLTFAEAVAEIGRAAGTDVRFATVPLDVWAAALAEQHVPADVVELLRYLFAEVLDGRNEDPADGVQRALGRAPRDFAEYARRTAATGVWTPRVAA